MGAEGIVHEPMNSLTTQLPWARVFVRASSAYIQTCSQNENYLSCSAVCYIMLIKVTLNMDASTILTCM